MRKLLATLLTLVVLTQTAPPIAAKQTGDWNVIKTLVKTSIAVKTTNGDTYFGLLQTIDDAGLEIQIADSDDFIPQEIGLRREEVEKVWIARLRFGQKHVGKGALIGAGAGLGAAFLTALAMHDSGDAPVGAGVFPIYGAGIGAIVGKAFWKKKHQKRRLVYSI